MIDLIVAPLLTRPAVCTMQFTEEYERVKTRRVNEAVMLRKISKLKDASKRCVIFVTNRTVLFCFVSFFRLL